MYYLIELKIFVQQLSICYVGAYTDYANNLMCLLTLPGGKW
jgi:hypothetical protein